MRRRRPLHLLGPASAERLRPAPGRYPEHPAEGWQPAPEAQRRVVRCIERLLAESDGDVCAVSHGLALSLYIASLDGRAAPSLEEWRSIPLPAVAVVEVEGRRLVEPFVQS